jgi:hypothetical protein
MQLKIQNYNRALRIINQVLKTINVKKKTARAYKVLAKPVLSYDGEAWN